MSGYVPSGKFDDVNNDFYVGGLITVGTTAVEAKVGATRLTGRETLIIYNKSSSTIYFGPLGVTSSTGIPITKGGYQEIPAGDGIGVYLIADNNNLNVIIQEMG